ncbi:hypothetical protein OROGR_029425 [Orobanche gracilis]
MASMPSYVPFRVMFLAVLHPTYLPAPEVSHCPKQEHSWLSVHSYRSDSKKNKNHLRMPEMEQGKKMVNQESFIRNRIMKAADHLKKLHKDNREKEMTRLMYQCLTGKGLQGLAVPELNDMGWLIDQNLKEIYKRIDGLKKAAAGNGRVEQKKTMSEMSGDVDGVVMQRMAMPPVQQQWFTEEWMGNNTSDRSQQQIGGAFGHGGGGGVEMMMSFNDGSNNSLMWSNVFFP